MSYDPSSFATNKTILQAIEEVKKFLIANPCYKVFYANTNYDVGTTTYSKTDVDDATSMGEYDVVFFNNNYYGKVESVGDSTFTIIGATNFKGDIGATGPTGISITGATINSSGHLIITLSDGNTIDAGYLPANYDNTITITNTSGTLTNDQYNKLLNDDSHIIYGTDLYSKFKESSTEMYFRTIFGGPANTRIDYIKITKSTKAYEQNTHDVMISYPNINSGNATSGQVLTADGSNGADWQTISTSYDNYVEINTTSGSFTDDEYAKLGFNDSVIVYDNGTYKTIYKKKIETSSIIEFEAIDGASRQNLKLIDVNKGTKAFSSTGISMITSSTFDSGAATSGKVLTANGSGGTSWETAGGGGTYYQHNIRWGLTATTRHFFISCIIINQTATAFNFSSLLSHLDSYYKNDATNYLITTGFFIDTSDNTSKYVYGIRKQTYDFKLMLANLTDGTTSERNFVNEVNIYDDVKQL